MGTKYTYIKRLLMLNSYSYVPSYDIDKEAPLREYICPEFVKKGFKVSSDHISVILSSKPIAGGIKVEKYGNVNSFSTPIGEYSTWSALYYDILSLEGDVFYILVEKIDAEVYNNAKKKDFFGNDLAVALDRLVRPLGRCQGTTAFRPVDRTYGGYGGDVKDRMRCTNNARTVVDGIELCGIHSCNPDTTRFHVRNSWANNFLLK